jgi:hypothetical protein
MVSRFPSDRVFTAIQEWKSVARGKGFLGTAIAVVVFRDFRLLKSTFARDDEVEVKDSDERKDIERGSKKWTCGKVELANATMSCEMTAVKGFVF